MSKLTINFLIHNRDFTPLHFRLLSRIKPENRSKVVINLLLSKGKVDRRQIGLNALELLNGIPFRIGEFYNSFNYMEKLRCAANEESDYFVKCDDDIFVSTATWDYLIENINQLDDPDIALFTNCISNGIPGCDLFNLDYLTVSQEMEMNEIYLKTRIDPSCNGVIPNVNDNRYGVLNKHTAEAKYWDYNRWWETVSTIDNVYLGVHPARISFEAQRHLNEIIMRDLTKFKSPQNIELLELTGKRPYLCSGFWASRTSTFRQVLNDPNVPPDSFEELMWNRFIKFYNKKWFILRKGFALHPYYNLMPNHLELEQEFYNKLLAKLTNE